MKKKYIMSLVISSTLALSLTGCGGGGGGSSTTTPLGTFVNLGVIKSFVEASGAPGTTISFNLSGTVSNGAVSNNLVGTAYHTISQPTSTVISSVTTTVNVLQSMISLTNTVSNVTSSDTTTSYVLTTGYQYNAIDSAGLISTPTGTQTLLPATAKVGDSGNFVTFSLSDGIADTETWRIDPGNNGDAIFVLTTTTTDTLNNVLDTESDFYTIKPDGTISALSITDVSSGFTIKVSGNAMTWTVSTSPPPKWTGTKQLGVAGTLTDASGVAVDKGGNVYVAGSTTSGLDGNTLTGSEDFFLILYDSSGNKVRTRQLGVAGEVTLANGIAVDSGGNVYVTGYTTGGLDGNTLMGKFDFFLTMYDSAGNKVRTKQLGVVGTQTVASGVAVDSSGNVYVAGYTNGGLDGNTLTGTIDFFFTMYDSSGNKVRTKQLGVARSVTWTNGVAVDSSGNVYVTGYTNGGLDGNTQTGTTDLFLIMYDSSGNKVRTKQLGVAGTTTLASGVAVDSSGNVYVAGSTYGGLDGNTLTGSEDFFLTMYDSAGNKVRTKQLGVAGAATVASGVAVDSGGNVYVAGSTYGGLDGNTLTGSEDFFLTKYDSSGNKVRTKQLGVVGTQTVASCTAADSSGDMYVTGYTTGGLDGNTLTGMEDFFLTKYDSSGNKQ